MAGRRTRQAAPQPGEWEEIQSEYNRLSHAAGLIDGSRAALDALSESDGAVTSVLNGVVHRLQQLADVDPACATCWPRSNRRWCRSRKPRIR
jgi:DNA repair ATPase RecN